ncbi:hypothetical protein [Halorussus halophilus]|uniref:hypothetical protein n=1 Tax=Halorussus halophilus TaxID=2650975 RepID=UPI001300E5D3|nr:hypothetical protein [Halorussus halophilus]
MRLGEPTTKSLLVVVLGVSTFAATASAHDGTAHGDVSHATLLALVVLGLGVAVGSSHLYARTARQTARSLTLASTLGGLAFATVGAIGLVESQVEPLTSTPLSRQWYPVLTLALGTALIVGTLLLAFRRWTNRPTYVALGVCSGLWVAYPALFARGALWNPLGYLLALLVPTLVATVLWRDVRPALAGTGPRERLVGVAVALGFVPFFLVSSGLLSFAPETSGLPDESVVVFTAFANPLVMWPAVEVFVPAVPVFAAISLGTALVAGLLASLVGVNAVLGVASSTAQSDTQQSNSWGITGALATSGATACCCCAPAAYGIASAALGASTVPLYWAFVDPASPVGSVFLMGAVGLLTANAVRLAGVVEQNSCEFAEG